MFDALNEKATAYREIQNAEFHRKYGSKLLELHRKMCDECEHPSASLEEFQWHHGYGQHVTGQRCTICGKYRAWKDMGEWKSTRPRMHFDD